MKTFLQFVFILFSLNALALTAKSFPAKATPSKFDSLEVIFTIASDNPDAAATIRNEVKGLMGVQLIAYCDNHRAFMVYIDKGTFKTKEAFMEQIKKDVPEYSQSLYLKDGSISGIVNYCDFLDPEDAKTIKLNFTK